MLNEAKKPLIILSDPNRAEATPAFLIKGVMAIADVFGLSIPDNSMKAKRKIWMRTKGSSTKYTELNTNKEMSMLIREM